MNLNDKIVLGAAVTSAVSSVIASTVTVINSRKPAQQTVIHNSTVYDPAEETHKEMISVIYGIEDVKTRLEAFQALQNGTIVDFLVHNDIE